MGVSKEKAQLSMIRKLSKQIEEMEANGVSIKNNPDSATGPTTGPTQPGQPRAAGTGPRARGDAAPRATGRGPPTARGAATGPPATGDAAPRATGRGPPSAP